jgi:hypothetical protein
MAMEHPLRSVLLTAALAAFSAAASGGLATVVPTLTTTAGATGGAVSDTAHLSGGLLPSGTITFRLYGPNDATCGGLAFAPEPLLVGGNGDYPSGDITPVLQGTYRWTASYSGDVANNPVATKCNDANETSIVTLTPTAQIPALGHGGLALFAALLGGAGWLLARK